MLLLFSYSTVSCGLLRYLYGSAVRLGICSCLTCIFLYILTCSLLYIYLVLFFGFPIFNILLLADSNYIWYMYVCNFVYYVEHSFGLLLLIRATSSIHSRHPIGSFEQYIVGPVSCLFMMSINRVYWITDNNPLCLYAVFYVDLSCFTMFSH